MAVQINRDYCKGCGICVVFCPTKVLVLDSGGQLRVEDQERCVSCGQCELRCPDFAIRNVRGVKGEKDEKRKADAG